MALALVLATTLALTGCGIERAGTAATIGDQTLSLATVDARTRAYFDAYPAVVSGLSRQQVASDTVQNYLRIIIVDLIAARDSITVSETEVDDFITQFGGMEKLYETIATQGDPPDETLARAEVRSAILQTKIQDLAGPNADDFARAAALTDRRDAVVQTLDIEVNPRFGAWDGSAVNVLNGSISITQAETTPTPTPTIPVG